jgi:hypothetical protein
MRNILLIIGLLVLVPAGNSIAQPVGSKPIRIVDSLTSQEKVSRNPVLLRSELDSLLKANTPVQVEGPAIEKPETANNYNSEPVFAALLILIFLVGGGIAVSLYHQQQIKKELRVLQAGPASPRLRGKITVPALEARISELNGELFKLTKENEGLNRVIREHNGIQHEYDSLKHGLHKVYKVKNYPGFDPARDENNAMQGVFVTESAVANYAYEKFLKPILAITDKHKNNPVKMEEADRVKLVELLISLSFLYIEYLYLRVSELSIGGKMVERIRGLAGGNGPDPSLLKKLNKENGSRALVMRLALDKAMLGKLSYPVFDETNLNNS